MKNFKWRKNIYKTAYILLPIVLFFLIALTAFMCNLCSVSALGKTKGSNADTDIAEEEDDNNSGQEGNTGKKDDIQNEKTSPSIELVIYEGPVFSDADNVCYYRIEAKVDGYPEPAVKFSRDDSNGAWGKYRAQVNLKKGQEYTIAATAANSEGEVADSMLLKYIEGKNPDNPNDKGETNDCDNDDITDEDEEEILIFIAPIVNEHTGFFVAGQNGYYREGANIFIGDAPGSVECPQPMPCTGFLTYRIDGIAGKKITEATIEFKISQELGDTSIFNNLIVSVFDENNDMQPMQSFSQDSGGNFTVNHPDFTAFIQKSLDIDNNGLEVYCQFDPYITDNDDSWDGWEYQQSDVIFKIKYIK